MSSSTVRLSDHVAEPRGLLGFDRRDQSHFTQRELDQFRLEAAQQVIRRQSGRIGRVAEMLGSRAPESFETLNDLVPMLYEEDEYKSYDRSWIHDRRFGDLTKWMTRFTAADYSAVDVSFCNGLTEWCRAIKEQTGDHICHSSGTSGTISILPRSPIDADLVVDQLLWNYQPFGAGGTRRFIPGQRNDVQFAAPQPRYQFRITTACSEARERRYLMPPDHMLPAYVGPEQVITQGKIRTATRKGNLEAVLQDPIVQEYKGVLEAYFKDFPSLLDGWFDDLVTLHAGKRVVVQMSSDMAWRVVQLLREKGVTNAFAPGSIYSLVGGNKDGSVLPDDWIEQFREAVGADDDSFVSLWGMSEVNAQTRLCPSGNHHFDAWIIPFLLEPGTRTPLPRTGVQTGQFAIMELLAENNWGGMISGDRATIDWNGECRCGQAGPLMDPQSISRI